MGQSRIKFSGSSESWGERVACYLACTPLRTRTFGIAKGFPDRYDPNELLAQNGMTVENMAAETVRLLNE